jgi:hypothetical protein
VFASFYYNFNTSLWRWAHNSWQEASFSTGTRIATYSGSNAKEKRRTTKKASALH